MPPLTHLLGPDVDAGDGKPQTQLLRRLSITRALIDQLPAFDFFKQALSSSCPEVLAFQDRGFGVSPQYTFEIDCRTGRDALWDAMHFKTRQHVRRAEEKYLIKTITDPDEFIEFYSENLRKRGRKTAINLAPFPNLFAETAAREAGEVLSACWPDGRPAAMVYLVWGHGRMYYLLSTRANDAGDNGSVNLLIWTAIVHAHQRGLVFDLDGVSTSGIARFLSGFGGELKTRMIVQRSRFLYGTLQYTKRRLIGGVGNETTAFT